MFEVSDFSLCLWMYHVMWPSEAQTHTIFVFDLFTAGQMFLRPHIPHTSSDSQQAWQQPAPSLHVRVSKQPGDDDDTLFWFQTENRCHLQRLIITNYDNHRPCCVISCYIFHVCICGFKMTECKTCILS